jgi:hypothetical protein
MLTRRRFLRATASAGLAAAFPLSGIAAYAGDETPPEVNVKNRAPLKASEFYSLPLGAVRPLGWLRAQLEIQARGLSGHLDEIWPDVGPNSGWLGGTGESWERGPYFVDGLLPLAYLLNDEGLKAKAKAFVEWTLTHQAADGMIGPPTNDDWWPRMVMVKVLSQYHDATQDSRVIPVLTKYFHHQLQALPARPLSSWGKFRWQDEVLVVLWLYNRTGDPKLIELAHLLQSQGFDWQANFAAFKYTQRCTRASLSLEKEGEPSEKAMATHGVNNAQGLKAAPVSYLLSGSEADRHGVFQQLEMLDQFHGLPNGMFSADEHLAGRNPSQGIELCAVVEQMFSLEQSLAILGRAELGDRLEKIAFNALPGTLTDDMWAHQYNQEPNQVECSLHRNPWTTDGPESNLFGLEPNFGCCTANYHQGWPKFAASVWMSSHDDGLVAATYAPSEVRMRVGKTEVHIVEETEYPFRGKVRFIVNPSGPSTFPLRLRIPGWASGASITVNGEVAPAPEPGTFARIMRRWIAGDVVELNLPMRPRITPGYKKSISIERGPFVFSLPIQQNWLKLRDHGPVADWQIYPGSQWNYALAVKEEDGKDLKVIESPVNDRPFAAKGTSVRIEVSARKVTSWRAEDGAPTEPPQSPVTTSEPTETITLVPYAAAKLRITSFPQTNV